MQRITKVKLSHLHTHTQRETDVFLFSQIALTALTKYETPMFQEFTEQDPCLFDNCFIFCFGICLSFIFKINWRFGLNNIIAIQSSYDFESVVNLRMISK